MSLRNTVNIPPGGITPADGLHDRVKLGAHRPAFRLLVFGAVVGCSADGVGLSAPTDAGAPDASVEAIDVCRVEAPLAVFTPTSDGFEFNHVQDQSCLARRMHFRVDVRVDGAGETRTSGTWSLYLCNRCEALAEVRWLGFADEHRVVERDDHVEIRGAQIPLGIQDASGAAAFHCPTPFESEWCGTGKRLLEFDTNIAPGRAVEFVSGMRYFQYPVLYDWRAELEGWGVADEEWLVAPSVPHDLVDYDDDVSIVYASLERGGFALLDACAASGYPIPAGCGFDDVSPQPIELTRTGNVEVPAAMLRAIEERRE